MKRVLLVGNHSITIYNFRKELVERLLEEGYEVHIALPCHTGVHNIEIMRRKGCTIHDIDVDRRGTNPLTDLKLIGMYKKLLKAVKPDVVLTYTIKPNIYCGFACRKEKIPQIANITGLSSAVENEGILQYVTTSLYRKAFKNVSCVFFQNEGNREFFRKKKILKGHSRLVPGSGVNLRDFEVMKYPDEDKLNFLFVGRVLKKKGIDEFLHAAEKIKNKYPNTSFQIIGMCDDEEYMSVLKEYENKGIIWYAGMQNDVKPFIKNAHCLIHPSYYPEGISNAILEAEACGRPVITTTRSGCRETIDDGSNGLLFEAKDVDMLVDRIETFIRIPHEEKCNMGLRARRKVENEFDRNIVIDAYIEEIELLLNGDSKNTKYKNKTDKKEFIEV